MIRNMQKSRKNGIVRFRMVWNGMVCMVWYYKVWYYIGFYGMVWYGMKKKKN